MKIQLADIDDLDRNIKGQKRRHDNGVEFNSAPLFIGNKDDGHEIIRVESGKGHILCLNKRDLSPIPTQS
jgi:hypothetical protein